MRIVITGASGNLGTAILRRLADDGHELIGVSRRAPEPVGPYSGVEWHEIDLATPDADGLLAPLLVGADALVHLAWKLQPQHDEAEMHATNVDGARRVFDAAAAARVGQLVVVSSVGAYSPGSKTHPAGEDWPTGGIPTSSYSRHKCAVERQLDLVERDHPALRVARVRPALVFQRDAASEIGRLFLGSIPPKLVGQLRSPIVPLPSALTLQVIHADDLADGIARIVQKRVTGAFNLAGDPGIRPRGLARLLGGRWLPVPARALRALVDASWRARIQPTEAGWLDLALGVPLMSTRRARTELGWRPRVDSRDALRELLDGMRDEAGVPASASLQPASPSSSSFSSDRAAER
ncbi:NAD-dependent epimerase/dehydratase family protein [Schumannella luteola]|uniref:Nucleoside-diphosphate-sugar epimerase n=1 Tax=Schumannella luteola TaxID=472059 RepID=A0A852YAQ7_9MICO|nr:NAD-dependent epimerase/dehydratase family protein [Schumannella luteola]NYG98440.1 nucleoside-diphosphate-sugar epimerase [Schumannella luteola]TPX01327.1 NAD-dependent epimerase/dehydratase family protein [Schumannella luteola]